MQTRRLMEVCRMRKTPVMIFINKLDREGQDAFDLLDELEEELRIAVRPLSWPIGIGRTFQSLQHVSFGTESVLAQQAGSDRAHNV